VKLRAAILAAGILALGAAPAFGGGAEETLWSALSPKQEKGKSAFDEVLCAKELVQKGPELAGPAIRILLGEVEEPSHDYAVDPRAIDARPRVLVLLLKGLPKADVLKAIDEAASSKEGVDRELLLVHVLAEIGGKESLDRVLALASKLDPLQWERTFVQVPVQDAIAGLVRNDAQAQKDLARRVQDSKPPFGAILVRALVQANASAAVAELTYSLGRDPRLDLCLSEALGALAENAAGTLSETALGALRAQLGATDARMVCAAANALGRLGDEACAEKLVQLLADPDGLKQHGALTALSALSGRKASGDAAEWKSWLEAENVWKTQRLPDLETSVSEEEVAVLPSVLAELVSHRLYRHRIAMSLTPMLESKNPDVVRLACGILPALGSRSVVSSLKAVVHTGNRETIPCARAALIALAPSTPGS
jgi:hypothetical protein